MLAITTSAAALAAFSGPALVAPSRAAVEMQFGKPRPKPKGKGAPKPVTSGKTTNLKYTDVRRASADIDVSGNTYVAYDASPQYDEIGVLPPIGRWDPLNIRAQGPERYRRFVEMEIKHGRLAMAANLGVITTYAGFRFPGYLSPSLDLKFEDVPGTMIGSWATCPVTGWFQIVALISFLEFSGFKQDKDKDAGDVVPDNVVWARYPDNYPVYLADGSVKNVGEDELFLGKTWKLNAERNNGRAAMMGITGMFLHELICGNPVFPLGETA